MGHGTLEIGGTRSPTESIDIQQKIVTMAIYEESSKFGMVKQMGGGWRYQRFQRQEREISSKTDKKSPESGFTPHSAAEHLVPKLL